MKGQLEEAMSKARFTKGEFYVEYRDMETLVMLPVAEFWKIADIIPAHRIARVLKWGSTMITDGKTAWPIEGFERLYESSDEELLRLPTVKKDKADPELVRSVEMLAVLAQPISEWRKYPEVESLRRLRESGRELLGREIYLTEKRDGGNTSIMLNPDGTFKISSHNMEEAAPDIKQRLTSTKEWPLLQALLKEEFEQYGKKYIIFGELIPAGYGATRIEPRHKDATFVLFDIFDMGSGTFLPYIHVYQYSYHYKLPIVKLVEVLIPKSMEELTDKIADMKKWAKRHKREGVVGKAYDPHEKWGQTFFKEKIDLPEKLPKIEKEPKVQLPEMPEDRILRALQHAYDVVGEEGWKVTGKAMPEIAKQLATEAREHNFAQPPNFFRIYNETPLEKIRPTSKLVTNHEDVMAQGF